MQMPTITRRDGTEVHPQIIELGARGSKREHKRIVEPVVDLAGHVIPAEVNTDLDKPGIKFVVESQGELQLTRHAKRLGMVFYRDMCMGAVDGVAASPVHWAIYEKIAAMKAKGQVPKGGYPNDKIYHPEVMRRRAAGDGEVERIDHAAMDAILEGLQGSDTDEDRAAARAAGLTVPKTPMATSVEELMERANG